MEFRKKPVAYRQHIEATKNGVTTKQYGYSDIQIMKGDDALYLVPPSAQVLIEALLTLLIEFNIMGRQDISDYIKNTITDYEAKLLQKE